MAAALNPLTLAQAIARNVVPLAGIVFFGWPAFNVLALYLLDTLFTMALIVAGFMRTFIAVDRTNWASIANSEVGYPGVGLGIVVMFGMPLGVPLIFMTGGDMGVVKATFTDTSFHTGVAVQFAAAFWSWLDLRRAVDAGHTWQQLRPKRRFTLVFLRWLALLMVAYTGLGMMFGRYAPFIFVFVYVAVTIVIEVAPDRFLRAMPGGAEDADPPSGNQPADGRATQLAARFADLRGKDSPPESAPRRNDPR